MDFIASQLRQGHYEAAYVATIRQGSDTADPHHLALRALTRWNLGHDADSLAEASRAIQMAPDDPLVRTVHGLTSLSVGALDDAWADAETARRIAPDEPLAIVLLAHLLDEHQQQDDAVALLDVAITRDPFDNDLRLARANVHADRNSLSDLDIILARSPEHLGAMLARGMVAEDRQDLLDRAVELAPHSADALIARAIRWCLADPPNLPAARADADHAFRLSRGSANSIQISALVDIAVGDLEGARNRLAGLHQGLPSTIATSWTAYAQVAFARGERAAAQHGVDVALDVRPTHVDALALRAMLRLEGDDNEGARRDARETLARDPTNVAGLSVEAALALFRDDWPAAADHADHALREDPLHEHPQSVIALAVHGLASAELGDLAVAERRLRELRQIGAADLADPLEGLVRQLRSTAPGRPSTLTTAREGADLIKTAIDIARQLFG